MAKESFAWGAELNFDAQRKRVKPTEKNKARFLAELRTCKTWFLDIKQTWECLTVISNFCAVTATSSRQRKSVLPEWRNIAAAELRAWVAEESPFRADELAQTYEWYSRRVELAKRAIYWAEEKRSRLSLNQRGASTYLFAGLLSSHLEHAFDETIYENYLFAELFYHQGCDSIEPAVQPPQSLFD